MNKKQQREWQLAIEILKQAAKKLAEELEEENHDA